MTNKEILDIAQRCIAESRDFWTLDPIWQIEVELKDLENESAMEIEVNADYLRAWLRIDPMLMTSPEDVWRHTAHEMTHLVLAPLDLVRGSERRMSLPRILLWQNGLESVAVRLEAVFLRERKP